MQPIPPLDPERHRLAPLLDAANCTADWLNSDEDPYSAPGIARRHILAAEKLIPFHYRDALPAHPDVRAWIEQLIKTAIDEQAEAKTRTIEIVHGPSLLLLGITGVGKTHEAYGAIRLLAASGVGGPWTAVTAADLYARLRPRHGVDPEAEFDRYAGARLLLLDDLGAGRTPTEFTEEINFRLINHRYENHLPTLVTTNVVPKQLTDRLGDRVASRLAEMCTRVAMAGRDRRRAA